jgi:hypothetical protein
MQSTMAAASSSGVELGIGALADILSVKMGRTKRVQPGQIAGAGEFLLAHKMPATKVPCIQAELPDSAHVPARLPEMSWILAAARAGWFIATGPSINPIIISDRPLVSCINGVSFTKSNGSMDFHLLKGLPIVTQKSRVASMSASDFRPIYDEIGNLGQDDVIPAECASFPWLSTAIHNPSCYPHLLLMRCFYFLYWNRVFAGVHQTESS